MDDHSAQKRSVSLVRYEDDHALVARGSLIPLALKKTIPTVPMVRPTRSLMLPVVVSAVLLLMVGFIGAGPLVAQVEGLVDTMATPALVVEGVYSDFATPPHFGPAEAYANPEFYTATQNSLIDGGATFIDLNIASNTIRYFKRGVLSIQDTLAHTPNQGSWCRTEAGLYSVEAMLEHNFSTYLGVTLPYSVKFGPNLFIHDWPVATDGQLVDSSYSEDCIRLDRGVAQALFDDVKAGTPVLVHAPVREYETFGFESKVPTIDLQHYLIADIASETILAVGDRYDSVPIASLTKLMTALIAIETMSLDDTLLVREPNLVESVIPRLQGESSVTLYSLLELLLVESSNEAAEVIANNYGRDRFIQAMNVRARELGLRDTVFVDPSGLGNGNVSSVNDLWWLTRYIYQYEPFIFTLTRDDAVLPSYVNDSFADLVNFNTVESIDSFIGGKVGETTAAKKTSVTIHRLLIGGAERDIAVILLGSDNRRADVLTLLEYTNERFPQ